MSLTNVFCPLRLGRIMWPDNHFADYQEEMVLSIKHSVKTKVVACNGSGKDHVAGFILATFFVAPQVYFSPEYFAEVHRSTPESWTFRQRHTRRIFTTSVADDHLRVLWAEAYKWLTTSRYPLLVQNGGDIVLTDLEMRFADEVGITTRPPNYAIGAVAEKPEKFSGHHARYTLAMCDEASGIPDIAWERFEGWAKRYLDFGNAESTENKFKKDCELYLGTDKDKTRGNLPVRLEDGVPGVKYFINCMRIRAEDSPNVKFAKEQVERGEQPTGENKIMGIVSWQDYVTRRKTLDPIRQSVMLDAVWYAGPEHKLIPKEWFDAAKAYGMHPWDGREGRRPPVTYPLYLGVDCAEGGDDTSWVLIDKHGILDVKSLKTADTNVIYGLTMQYLRDPKLTLLPENVCFDRGGGGKQCADRIRANGGAYAKVRTVSFGVIKHEPKRGIRLFKEKTGIVEDKGEARNRRSEMYWDVRTLMELPIVGHDDPTVVDLIGKVRQDKVSLPPRSRFAFPMTGTPPMCEELIRQLACVPLRYDGEGRFDLIPKQTEKDNPLDPEDTNTFRYLIGRSPDIADGLGCAVHAYLHKPSTMTAGVS